MPRSANDVFAVIDLFLSATQARRKIVLLIGSTIDLTKRWYLPRFITFCSQNGLTDLILSLHIDMCP